MDYFSHEIPRRLNVATDYAVKVGDDIIHITAGSTITLYSAVGKRREVTVKRIYAGGISTLATVLGQTIDGVATKTFAANNVSFTVYTNNGNWWVK